MTIKPITPADAARSKNAAIPDAVIEAFNELIVEHWTGTGATFTQDRVIARILLKRPDLSRQTLFLRHWLDVEDLFRAQGWAVSYDRPGYNETYDVTFTFAR